MKTAQEAVEEMMRVLIAQSEAVTEVTRSLAEDVRREHENLMISIRAAEIERGWRCGLLWRVRWPEGTSA